MNVFNRKSISYTFINKITISLIVYNKRYFSYINSFITIVISKGNLSKLLVYNSKKDAIRLFFQ